ncbi:MAG: HAD-IIB family hydrolase [Nitrospirae bacterium]|nr:MAG: HAD-IIB family hydrolase [Nitrospirota bacterium]
MKRPIIFTDLDGTLLDSKTYRFDEAREALELIRKEQIPLIIVSSKTRAEIELYRKRLKNTDPFVSENGGGIFIPVNYEIDIGIPDDSEKTDDYYLLRLGTDYRTLRAALDELRKEGYQLRGFGDMDIEEVMKLTGLTREEALLCKRRDFDEPFIFQGNNKQLRDLKKRISQLGFNCTEGRFLHILGNNDKGRAIRILIDLYKASLGEIKTIALGDSRNDYEMLREVDIPVVIMRQDGSFNEKLLQIEKALRTTLPGPPGWQEAIKRILKML